MIRLSEEEQTLIRAVRRLRGADRSNVFAAITAPVAPRTIKTRAEIRAGKGFPCTAPTPCARKDLKTAARASEHVTTNADLQLRGHIAK